ncbi:MAG: sulfotransferase, partial [Actinomycetota bacterium]|nr:sulfotransferase [Actinomycetota bacterium]
MQDVTAGQFDPARTGPVFLVGARESGSSVLRSALNRHPGFAIASETGFLRAVTAQEWIPFWKFGDQWYGRLGLSQEQLHERLRDFYGRMFGRFAERQGKRRWGDETPLHAWHVLQAAQLFPDATFVATVRHPSAVAAALHDSCGQAWKRSFREWTETYLELVHHARDLADRFLLCRYEDLLANPEGTLRQLLAALGEPWSPAVLDAAGTLGLASPKALPEPVGSAAPRGRAAALA